MISSFSNPYPNKEYAKTRKKESNDGWHGFWYEDRWNNREQNQ
ncbi:MAG TPA: hypothetical protein PLY62_06835 [Bacteroidales bacterium]|nr:hypothetical protein [Bacteroidales bacterium]